MRPPLHRAGDLAAMTLLLVVAVVGFAPAFGGLDFAVAGIGGIVVGLAIAAVAALRRWGVLLTGLATVLAYLLLGGALAVRSDTIAGVIPSIDTLRSLVFGAVYSWKQLLTLAAPVADYGDLLIVPFISALVTSVLAGSFALRLRRSAWALVPATALLVVGIAFGTQEVVQPVIQGVVFAGVAILWQAWRVGSARAAAGQSAAADTKTSGQARSRRMALGAALLAAAILVGVATSGALAPEGERRVLRDAVVPPLDLRAYASPLAAYRKYVRDFADTTLFTISGLPSGARVRLATLDSYDGVVYNVSGDGSSGSGTFARMGTTVPNSARGEAADLTVTVGEFGGVWVPDAGYLSSLTFSGSRAAVLNDSLHYNGATGAAVATAGLREGDTYEASVIIPQRANDDRLDEAAIGRESLAVQSGVPDSLGSTARDTIADAKTPFAQVTAIAATLSTEGAFSHGLEGEVTSRAGHGSERITTLLDDRQMVGDDEQYAVAMALMVRELGMPARVVMGFYPADDTDGADTEITGSDLHAWVEVAFDGAGWVSFDPTPPEDQIPQEQQPEPQSKPQAQVLQPPPPAQEPVELPSESSSTEQAADEKTTSDLNGLFAALGIAGGVLGILIVLLAPALAVLWAKARRRRRRRSVARSTDRFSGGWDEVVDVAIDQGVALPVGATRHEGAALLAASFPTASVAALAVHADNAVFGPGEPSDADVERFWNEADALVAAMSAGLGRFARLRALLSLKSFTGAWRRSLENKVAKR